ALLPPMRSTGDCLGFRSRISWTSTGLMAPGLEPVYSRTALYSNENPRNPGAIGRPTGVRLSRTSIGGGATGAVVVGVVVVGVVVVGGMVVIRGVAAGA